MTQVVAFDLQDYVAYGTVGYGAILSSRHRAMLASCFALMMDRENWSPMTDAQWDVLEEELAEVYEVLNA